MKTQLNRRDWFKSTLAITAGLTLTSSLTERLMAAPMSEAERVFFGLGSKSNQKVRLNSNENPYGPSDKARKAVIDVLSRGNRYAFTEMVELQKQIAEKEGVDPDHILIGAGSGELLCQTGIAYGLEGGRVLSAYPTFPLLMNYAQQMKATWDKVDLNEKLEHNYEALASAIKSDTRLVFSCNPNNPTGTVVSDSIVKSFCEEASKKTLVYADEAYLEFLEPAQQKSMVPLVQNNPNLIVSKTFSKIYGLAGLRIGYIVGHPDTLKKVAQYGDTISASQTAIAAAKASLGDEDFMKLTRVKNAVARKVLTDYLDQKKIMTGTSVTNVLLFPAPKDGKTILTQLEEKGYLIRIWDYQQKEWCRVSIGTQEEMKGFVKVFDEVVA
ncbi:MAG: aminotransferase class I/II-fold pyridoxal phosphate-dependent enzyme [Bacteroidia bacterium]|nr:aminotransferase class I/II-fold pyridoxal phosphate-dependent enzyme [Bacteroidia bacterium]